MKKSYDSTIEDAVYVSFRFAEHVGSVRKQKWLGLIWVLILVPLVLALFPDPFSVNYVAIGFASLYRCFAPLDELQETISKAAA